MKVIFLVPPRVHLLDLSGAVHIFYEAIEYGAAFELQFVAIDETQAETVSSSGLHFTKLEAFANIELQAEDYVFVPGLDMSLIQSTVFKKEINPFQVWLRRQWASGATLASICTGAFLLAQSGLLDGREATTHWKYVQLLQEQFPRVSVQSNRLFVENDRIYTSAGVASGIDMALYIVEKKCGTKLAADLAREVVVYFRRGEQDPQLSIFLQYRNHLENRVHDVQDYISHHLDQTLNVEELAAQVHVSPRHLTRLFKQTTGITVGQYIEKMRVEQALRLLEARHKVEYVAHQIGYSSTNRLRQLLRKYVDKLPSELQ